MRTLKWLVALVGLLLVLALGGATLLLVVLGNTAAPASGTMALAELEDRVEVVRDREGIPHVFGSSLPDLAAGLGFAHAQDRLWQMELWRRAGEGRLSEIFGAPTVNTDVFLRTLDLAGHAARSFEALPAATKQVLEAYARGVNAYLERSTRLLEPRFPLEFLVLRHRPEPWRPSDSVLIVKMMALRLGTNLQHEIARLAYAACGLTPEEIADLMPPEDGEPQPPLPDLGALYPLRRTAELAAPAHLAFLDDLQSGGASNNWVVSGARTRSGHPLLANDPHLRLSAPSIWYLAHLGLQRPERTANIVGASLPGTPLIVLGRADTIAWGFTTTGADAQDLFIEKVNPENPDEYLTPEGWRPFRTETVTVQVKDGDPITFRRRISRHGPVLPEFYGNIGALLGAGHVAALQWTALSDDDTTLAAGMFDPRPLTVAQFMEKMRLYVVPMQSMVAADTSGTIGLIAPGRVPVRSKANAVAGRAPVPGWDPTYDWQGFVPFEELPRLVNPPAGAIATSNTRIVGADYPHVLTLDWDARYRQQRLQELILDRTGHDMGTMRSAQLDVLSLPAVRLKTLMVRAARAAGGAADAKALDALDAWDGGMRAGAPEPLIFTAWEREAVRAIYRDDLGPAFSSFFDSRATAMIRLLEGEARARDWCDDRTTPQRESCGTVLVAALARALRDLEGRYGADRSRWRWGEAHLADGEHIPLGRRAWIGRLVNVEVPSPGGDYTLNRGKMDFGAEPPFANRHAASFRAIYDLGDLDSSLYMQPTGQSGDPFSPLYRNFAERWAEGKYIRIPAERSEIDGTALGTWRLTPKAASAAQLTVP